MTPTQQEIISQLQSHLAYVHNRIAFHSSTRQRLIDEASSTQAQIDAIAEMRQEELALCLRVNMADEGQD